MVRRGGGIAIHDGLVLVADRSDDGLPYRWWPGVAVTRPLYR
jgi:hypothetical protein